MRLEPGAIEEFYVEPEEDGLRLDRFLADRLQTASSRSQVQKWIKMGQVSAEEAFLRSSVRVQSGEVYRLTVPEPVLPNLTPENLNLKVLFEDESLAVIIKPAGVAVHPGPGESRVTLLNGLLHLWSDLPEHTDHYRPGIVHRLDRDTEGLLLVAKNETSLRALSKQFHDRKVYKEYRAWVHGIPRSSSATITEPLERHPHERTKMRVARAGEGRNAQTEYEVLDYFQNRRHQTFALLKLIIATGRTHQIRVHLAHQGHAVIGDPLYSRDAAAYQKYGLLLLASRLHFTHPVSGEELQFELELPERFFRFKTVFSGQ